MSLIRSKNNVMDLRRNYITKSPYKFRNYNVTNKIGKIKDYLILIIKNIKAKKKIKKR